MSVKDDKPLFDKGIHYSATVIPDPFMQDLDLDPQQFKILI